ncbi:transporter [Kineobactrum salinum]|uniref:Transporter n=1 Tax=Kineobactrum salinum TaxID=2708301 RepID=A0A6C0U169_9GAMM|nr:transporter [Kineobactrum salinum]QIB65309.1 transporter [Kineobactrum salinum]
MIKDSPALDIPRIADNVGGVLTGRGKFILEPSLQYSYSDNNRVFLDGFTFLPAIAIGLIDLREIKRHSTIFSVAGRYGLSSRLEAELRVPYVYREDSQRSRPVSIGVGDDQIFEADGDGLGDIELALRYQLNEGRAGWPVFIGNLVTSFDTGSSPFDVEFVQSTPGAMFPTELPTGAGYLSVQPGISMLYPTDPGVFFGNLSYSWNEETDEDIAGIERSVDPGDTLGLGFGMGFALNDRSSFSIAYSHKHVFASKTDGVEINGSVLDIGQLSIGYSVRANTATRYNLSVNIGTTDDAQNVGLTLRMPMTF